jgi:hypothetical protein
MENIYLKTVSETVNELSARGYKNDFMIRKDHVLCTPSNKKYQPEELEIIHVYRFEGITDPGDQAEVFAIEAIDGTKGTMTVPYGASIDFNADILKRIQFRTK